MEEYRKWLKKAERKEEKGQNKGPANGRSGQWDYLDCRQVRRRRARIE